MDKSPAPKTSGNVAELLESIDYRLARLEHMIAEYEPLVREAARRMAGPLRWRKER